MLALPERLRRPAGRRVEDEDRLADGDRAGGAVAGQEVGVSRVRRLDRVGAGRQARRREAWPCRTRAPRRRASGRCWCVVSKKSTVPVGVPEPGALAVTVAVKVTALPDVREARRCAGGGRGAILVDHLADGCRDGAGVEVAVAAGIGRGDRDEWPCSGVLVVKVAWSWPLTTLERAGADRRAVVVEGHRAGGAGDGRAARADDAHRGGERHRLAVAPTGLSEVATVALVFALLTTWVTAVEAGLGMKLASPLV